MKIRIETNSGALISTFPNVDEIDLNSKVQRGEFLNKVQDAVREGAIMENSALYPHMKNLTRIKH